MRSAADSPWRLPARHPRTPGSISNRPFYEGINIILTQKAILMLILVFASTAYNVTGVDGQCIDDRTGEPLKQVRDVDGQLWSVEKAVEELGTLTLEYCGVSINVPLGGRPLTIPMGKSTIRGLMNQ